MRTYQTEFPDFGELDVALPAGFNDVSWHHDAMPGFAKTLADGTYLLVMIEYADVAKRESPALARFAAMLYASAEADELRQQFSTNDWSSMISWLNNQEEGSNMAKTTEELAAELRAANPTLDIVVLDKKETAYVDDEKVTERLIGVQVKDFTILDPFHSECGRFDVYPDHEYGIPGDVAERIRDHNQVT